MTFYPGTNHISSHFLYTNFFVEILRYVFFFSILVQILNFVLAVCRFFLFEYSWRLEKSHFFISWSFLEASNCFIRSSLCDTLMAFYISIFLVLYLLMSGIFSSWQIIRTSLPRPGQLVSSASLYTSLARDPTSRACPRRSRRHFSSKILFLKSFEKVDLGLNKF